MDGRLPNLGPRGEGWFAIQLTLIAGVGLAGLAGPGWSGAARTGSSVAGAAALATGAAVVVRGLRDLGRGMTPLPRPRPGGDLVESGVYGRIRHPVYAGLVLGAVGWGLVTASPAALGLAAALGAFLDVKARREEAWLAEAYPGYPAYRRRTRRFVPGVY